MHCAAGGGEDIDGLRHDIVNSLQHCLGNHERCRPYFCSTEGGSQSSSQIDSPEVINAAQRLLDNLALNADKLRNAETSNKAENFFSLASKIIMGKRENITNRGNYSLRIFVAILLYNDGFTWSIGSFEKFTGRRQGIIFNSYASQRDKQREYSARHAAKPEAVQKRYAVKITEEVSYGPGLQKSVTQAMLSAKKLEFTVSLLDMKIQLNSN